MNSKDMTYKDLKLDELKSRIKEIGNIPTHVAIIMDGNGRWAKRHGLPVKEGHAAGVNAAKNTVKIAHEMDVKVLTLYTFSRQNWKRSASEISALMSLLSSSAYSEVEELIQEGVKVIVSGDIDGLPLPQRKAMQMVMNRTSGGEGLILNLALNYGGREEILRATRLIAEKVEKGELPPTEIDQKLFDSKLFTAGLPDPDLLVRTSGEMRVSNFLLWQTAYSEFYVTDTLWPDFDHREFCLALMDYAHRERRFGGRSED